MAEQSWPWSSVAGDRPVASGMVKQANADAGFIGVIGGLTPTKVGSTVQVAAGSAIINGVTYVLDATATVTPSAGTRKDYVILRFSSAARSITLVNLEGTSGAFPTLTKTDAVYEIAIASIDNSAGAFTVTDTRADTTLCGRKTFTQAGIGQITAAAGTTGSAVVTFPRAYSAVPVVVASMDNSGTSVSADLAVSTYNPTTSQVTIYFRNSSAGSRTITYSWIAVGY